MTAIVAGDILLYTSAPTATAGFATANTTAETFLGKYMSSSQVSGTSLNNIYTDITGAQNAASQVDYQCIFVLNNTSSGNSMLNTVVWINNQVAGGATVNIGLDPAGITSKTSSSAQAALIANATTAPSGVTFSAAASSGAGLSVGTVAPGNVFAVWIKRMAANNAPVNNDGFTLEIDFDTQG